MSAALLQVQDECRRRLVGRLALPGDVARQLDVLVPAAMKDLNEPHAALGQPAREETVCRVGSRLFRVRSVQFECLLCFLRRVGQLGDRSLHAVGEFVLRDAGRDFGIAEFVELHAVEPGEIVKHAPAGLVSQAVGVREVEHRVA